jgi:hypothetical protein
MVLTQVLQELESAQGPASLDDLSRKLGVERTALEGMIAFWVRKGRLKQDYVAALAGPCAADGCDSTCPQAPGCRWLTNLPCSFSLPKPEKQADLQGAFPVGTQRPDEGCAG